MQIFVLAMVILLSFFEQSDFGQREALARLGGVWVAMMMVVPKLAVVGLYAIQCRLAASRLAGGAPMRTLRRLDRVTSIYRVLALSLFFIDLSLGALELTRERVGDLILIDELLVMLPALLMVGAEWWLYYPIYRRLRNAMTMGRLDAGGPLYPTQTRSQFLLSQFRHQMALLLAPLLLLLAWREAVMRFVPASPLTLPGTGISLILSAQIVVGLLGVGAVFLLAPVIIRWMWDTVPLPEGDMRDRLVDMCRRHGVRIRELLLWRTFGGLGNAAVMGLIAPVRFILLSDLLLESVPQRQIEAIMAHELAHVKKRHMFWMAICIFAIATVVGTLVVGLLSLARWVDWPVLSYLDDAQIEIAVLVVVLLAWFPAFGWVSRRFERQADAFAVRHLTHHPPAAVTTYGVAAMDAALNQAPSTSEPDGPESGTPDTDSSEEESPAAAAPLVSYESVASMTGALESVAAVNQIDPHRKSWRHGSIAWRQAYLRQLVGRPADQMPIDRQVGWIQALALLVLATYFAATVWSGAFTTPPGTAEPPQGPILLYAPQTAAPTIRPPVGVE